MSGRKEREMGRRKRVEGKEGVGRERREEERGEEKRKKNREMN